MINPPTLGAVQATLLYNRATGRFIRRKTGKPCGQIDGSTGYLYVYVGNKKLWAHRVAWLLTTGEWPSAVDHGNRNKTDNRIANLRLATKSQNGANTGKQKKNRSGIKGVSLCKATGRWRADIQVRGKRINLGRAGTPAAAASLYAAAANLYFGEFARST